MRTVPAEARVETHHVDDYGDDGEDEDDHGERAVSTEGVCAERGESWLHVSFMTPRKVVGQRTYPPMAGIASFP